MAFSVIYAQTAFTSLGANKVKPKTLHAEVLAQPAITTVLDRIRVDNPGSGGTPEVDDPTGRTWAFIFNGAGPLSGPESTALSAIVAAHTGIEAASPSMLQLGDGTVCTVGTISVGQVFSRTGANAIGGVAAGGGEVNTSSNSGASGTGIALAKVGADLPFAKIDGANGIVESLAAGVLSIDGAALLPRDGSRAMTGALNMGSQAITSVGNVDGRDVSADGAALDAHIASDIRHLPASIGTALQQIRVNAGATAPEWFTPSGGDVTGPAGGTVDTELALFSSTTGKALKGSGGFTLDLTTGRFAAPSGMTGPGIVSGGANKLVFGITSAGVQDSTPVAAISSAIGGGTNGATVNLHAGSRNPDGNVSAFSGFYLASAGTSSGLFFKNSGATDTVWREAMHVAAVSAPRRIVATKSGTLQSDAPFLAAMKRYISGLVMVYVSGSPDSFTVDVGECMDETGVYPMQVTSIKTVTCAAGNLDTGIVTSATLYHVWLFGKSTGAENDTTVRFSLSPSAPTYPSGYDVRRRIGSVRTNATTTFIPFVQTGTSEVRRYLFRQDTTAAPCAAVAAGTAVGFTTMAVPVPKTATGIYLQVTCGAASMTASLVDSAQAANITTGTARAAVGASGSGTQIQVFLPLIPALTAGAATPQYKVSSGSTTINVSGYEESL